MPKDIFSLINLEELIIENNILKTISEEIYKLKKLSILSLSNNKLESLPIDINKLNNLRELDIHDNPALKSLPSKLSELQLEYLSIDGNLLNENITIIKDLIYIQKIFIYGGLLSQEVFECLAKFEYLRSIEIISIVNDNISRSIGNLTLIDCGKNLDSVVYKATV